MGTSAMTDTPRKDGPRTEAAKLAAWFEWARYVTPTDQPGWHHWWAEAFLKEPPTTTGAAPSESDAVYLDVHCGGCDGNDRD